MKKCDTVYIFQGVNSSFPSAVFSNQESALDWIKQYNLKGILTEYPIDYPVYNWAIDNGYFKPKDDSKKTSNFIASFTSFRQKHWHFVDGVKEE